MTWFLLMVTHVLPRCCIAHGPAHVTGYGCSLVHCKLLDDVCVGPDVEVLP